MNIRNLVLVALVVLLYFYFFRPNSDLVGTWEFQGLDMGDGVILNADQAASMGRGMSVIKMFEGQKVIFNADGTGKTVGLLEKKEFNWKQNSNNTISLNGEIEGDRKFKFENGHLDYEFRQGMRLFVFQRD